MSAFFSNFLNLSVSQVWIGARVHKENIHQFLLDLIVLKVVHIREDSHYVLLHQPPQLSVLEVLIPGRVLALTQRIVDGQVDADVLESATSVVLVSEMLIMISQRLHSSAPLLTVAWKNIEEDSPTQGSKRIIVKVAMES